MKTLLTVLLFLTAIPADSQTFCSRQGSSISCDGDNLSNRTITPLGRNGGIITDERGNVMPYFNNGTILDDRKTDWERQSEERRREMIYGDDRARNESRSRSSREDER